MSTYALVGALHCELHVEFVGDLQVVNGESIEHP